MIKDGMFFVHHHLGLGDHLDCNGMVRNILKNGFLEHNPSTVGVFSKGNYYDMIEYMYRDEPNIIVFNLGKEDEYTEVKRIVGQHSGLLLRVGHENYPGKQAELSQQKNCWEFFYEQIDMPYQVRYDDFFVQRDLDEENRLLNKLNPNGEPFIFIHEDTARGFTLNRDHFVDKTLKTIENDITENIFNFISIIEKAEEIHCMESSFKTLIDIYAKQDKIFYHDFRHQPLGQNSLDTWKIVNYD